MRLLIFLSLVFSYSAHAFEGRLFGYGMQLNDKEMNDSLTSQSLKTLKNIPGWGIEFDQALGSVVRLGVRYTNIHWHVGDGSGSYVLADGGFTELDANMLQLMLRFTVSQSANARIELFGGAGGVQATLDTKAGGIEDKQGINGLQPMESAGLAVVLGAKTVFFTMEGGYQWASVTNLEQSDTTQPKISKIELSSPFVTLGITVQTDAFGGGGSKSSSKSSK